MRNYELDHKLEHLYALQAYAQIEKKPVSVHYLRRARFPEYQTCMLIAVNTRRLSTKFWHARWTRLIEVRSITAGRSAGVLYGTERQCCVSLSNSGTTELA